MLVFYTGTVMVNIDIIEKHSVIDVSDSTIFTTKFKRTFNHKVLHLVGKFSYYASNISCTRAIRATDFISFLTLLIRKFKV